MASHRASVETSASVVTNARAPNLLRLALSVLCAVSVNADPKRLR